MYLLKRSFWSITRIIRLAIGLVAIGEAISSGQIVFYLIGGTLLVQSLLVKQDCSYHCATDEKEINQNKEIEYEEIK
tara:strand:- start:5261 stop:5491 length:231 start_codon:yes stop_codon:yes gene_type:complete